jgi:lysozyme family protein
MPPTPEQTSAGYHRMWDHATIDAKRGPEVRTVADKIMTNRAKYEAVEAKTGVPWFMIGPIHNRESSLRFNAHLHCGDPLTARTVHVPKGRPAKGNPPFTWPESAQDALTMPPHSLDKVKNWSVERVLYETEKFNGWGYIGKGNSPYLWAATTEYHGGKYVADHVYDPNAWDKQLGCAAILKELAARDATVAARLSNRQATPPPEVVAEQVRKQTKNERNAIGAGTAGGVGAGATKASVETPSPAEAPVKHVTMGYLVPIAIALCVVVVVVAAVTLIRKTKTVPAAIAAKWGG